MAEELTGTVIPFGLKDVEAELVPLEPGDYVVEVMGGKLALSKEKRHPMVRFLCVPKYKKDHPAGEKIKGRLLVQVVLAMRKSPDDDLSTCEANEIGLAELKRMAIACGQTTFDQNKFDFSPLLRKEFGCTVEPPDEGFFTNRIREYMPKEAVDGYSEWLAQR